MTLVSPVKWYALPLLFCSLLVIVSSLILGLIGHALYWLRYHSFARWRAKNECKLKWTNDSRDDEYHVLIIGTGFSGLGMAIKLNHLGVDNYVLIERHAHVGGTWYANTYPGCACDVPSNLYSFSFELNPDWSHYFSRQPEIRAYLDRCAVKYDIRRHIEFETTVTEMRWIEQSQRWQVTTRSSSQERSIYARFVIAGSGPLSNASYPTDIVGIDRFEGEMCHTAAWNAEMSFRDKRVAVIGTGASAIQAVPKIHEMDVTQLLVFQRTPPWVIPRLDRRLHQWEKNLYRRVPILQKLSRVMLYWATESFALTFAYRWPIRFVNQHLARYYLHREVKDPLLRKKLTPTWDFGCKRMLLANDWYSTLQQSNVTVVTERIREVKSRSIVTSDGVEHPVDIIIWSTGFQTQTFPIPVYGINGCSLIEQWSKTMQVPVPPM